MYNVSCILLYLLEMEINKMKWDIEIRTFYIIVHDYFHYTYFVLWIYTYWNGENTVLLDLLDGGMSARIEGEKGGVGRGKTMHKSGK